MTAMGFLSDILGGFEKAAVKTSKAINKRLSEDPALRKGVIDTATALVAGAPKMSKGGVVMPNYFIAPKMSKGGVVMPKKKAPAKKAPAKKAPAKKKK